MSSFKYILLLLPFLVFGQDDSFEQRLSEAAIELTQIPVQYDPGYFSIRYPNGDVPEGKGVCTDVVIRAYRQLGIDLQERIHLDMVENFDEYPDLWGLTSTDTNIDHRRVPNQMKFFERHGKSLPVTDVSADYRPGHIVSWNLWGGVTHIGIVVNKKSEDRERFLISHNIGNGQELSDCLFSYKIIGHYSFKN